MNSCQRGHKSHKTILVKTIQGNMWVYDWKQYAGYDGYCTGQDDVSRTLADSGNWGVRETALIESILVNGDKGIMLDFGSHIGWYTIMAAKLGYTVHAFEADSENIELMERNMAMQEFDGNIIVHEGWVDKDTPRQRFDNVELMKSDLEGNDRYAVQTVALDLADHKVKHIWIEMSPIFNDSYEGLHLLMETFGYLATDIDGKPFDGKFEGQFDLHYEVAK